MQSLSIAEAQEITFDTSAVPDIHAYLAGLRAHGPIARSKMGVVFALRHQHLELITRDVTRQIETEAKLIQGIVSGPIFDFVKSSMLFSNGDVHLRRRAPVSRTFAFKLMDAMRPKAAALAAELVKARIGLGPIDFVNEIAAQVPARIIADILGIPRGDLPVFMQWIADTAEALGFINLDRRHEIEKSLVAFNDYVAALLAERHSSPQEDFLSEYVVATAQDGELSEAEIRTQIVGLILAGSDTTRGSMCMTLAYLLQHAEQWSAFCADPDGLKRAAVDEGAAFRSGDHGNPPYRRQGFRHRRLSHSRGRSVHHLRTLGSARSIRLCRSRPLRHIPQGPSSMASIFGAGAHRCVGEALARAEMEEALATIARLAPGTRLIGAFPRLLPGAIRQVDRMEVEFIHG